MATTCRDHGVAWRPHCKCHKSPVIAHMQISAGAIGVTCAKLGEAEIMAAAGITDLLIANLLVGSQKIQRLAALRRLADPIVCVDHIEQAVPISQVMTEAGQSIRVLIEIDIGMQRVGVAPGAPVLELARQIAQLPGLTLSGVMGYEGHLLLIEDPDEKAARITQALNLLGEAKQQLERADLACPIVSCGGTGSFDYAVRYAGATEVQAGGGIFMDEFYRRRCHVKGLEQALTVLATVVSRPAPQRAIVDAGRKTMNMELFMPRVMHRDGIEVKALSAEHGILELAPHAQDLAIGERLEFVPGYGDFTTVLHDCFYALRANRLEAIWPLQARGKLQ